MCAKHYENPTMLSRVTAKNVGDVFLRHTLYCDLQGAAVKKDPTMQNALLSQLF